VHRVTPSLREEDLSRLEKALEDLEGHRIGRKRLKLEDVRDP